MWHRALLLLVVASAAAAPVPAQQWNDARTRDLVERATRRRALQLADSALVDYTASARGYLTFLAQLGDGFLLRPRVVKADQLALEIHWKAPNSSKQWILGRRDTLLLPTDIQYHRDHLGIVQNNFPDIIRLGDGDEVRDVPHPLSRPGLVAYDFAIGDSLRIEIPGRTIDVYEVRLRPRDERAPGAVGALYLAKDDAQVVRMAFSFTRSALRDPQLDDVSIILENALMEERFWLPRRQEIEIRRSGSWMDFPVRGIIRGRWEIGDYKVNAGGTAATAPGPEIVLAPPARRAAHRWPPASILDSLPADVALATNDDVRAVQDEARRLVRAQALARARTTRPAARSFSEMVQVNRVEGFTVGGGLRHRFGAGVDAAVHARFGIADEAARGALSLGWERSDGLTARLRLFDDFREAGDEPETSRARNSIAAQEFGADYTDPFGARGGSLALGGRIRSLWRWTLDAGIENQRPLEVNAEPAQGRYAATLAADRGRSRRLSLRIERPPAPWRAGFDLALRAEGRVIRFTPGAPATSLGPTSVARAAAAADLSHTLGRGTVALRLAAAGVRGSDGVPLQEAVFAGGPVSGPGYRFHEFRGTALGMARVELRRAAPFIPIPLGRWGRVPGTITLAPNVGALAVDGRPGLDGVDGVYPFVGIGALGVFDLLRVDVSRGLRGSGRWRFSVDVTRDFWPIL